MKRKGSYENSGKKYKKVHYLILTSLNSSTNAFNSRTDGEIFRNPSHGNFVEMTYSFNRPIQYIQSLNLVGFELTINVNELVAGTGNEKLYDELIKGIDFVIKPSYGNLEEQIHHPLISTNFHIEFKKIVLNKYNEHNNLITNTINSGFTTTMTTTQTDAQRIIYNQEVLHRNFETYNTLNTMYDWLVERQNIAAFVRNENFVQRNFDDLVEARNYDRVGEFTNENGGQYYTMIGASFNVNTQADPTRISEQRLNIGTIENFGQPNESPTRVVRRSETIPKFYEEDYNAYRLANPDKEGDSDGWSSDRRNGFGRYYNIGDDVNRELLVAHERTSNIAGTNTAGPTPFVETTYAQSTARLRGGTRDLYMGRYYTTSDENRIYKYVTNRNSVSREVLADIHTFLIQNNKQFILNTQAREYLSFLKGYRDRTMSNSAVPPLRTTDLTTTSITTTSSSTSTPVGSMPTASPQIQTLQYFNTSDFYQTSRASSGDILPQLDNVVITMIFPHLTRENEIKIREKLISLYANNNVNYSLTLGVCIKN